MLRQWPAINPDRFAIGQPTRCRLGFETRLRDEHRIRHLKLLKIQLLGFGSPVLFLVSRRIVYKNETALGSSQKASSDW